jgi:hypothetical protein
MTVVADQTLLAALTEPAELQVSAPIRHDAARGDRQASADSQTRQRSDT